MTIREFVEEYGASNKTWKPVFSGMRRDGLIVPNGELRSRFVRRQPGGQNVWSVTELGKSVMS